MQRQFNPSLSLKNVILNLRLRLQMSILPKEELRFFDDVLLLLWASRPLFTPTKNATIKGEYPATMCHAGMGLFPNRETLFEAHKVYSNYFSKARKTAPFESRGNIRTVCSTHNRTCHYCNNPKRNTRGTVGPVIQGDVLEYEEEEDTPKENAEWKARLVRETERLATESSVTFESSLKPL